MSKECGPSLPAVDLDTQIGSAMDTVKDSFVGSAAGGIADGISGLKSSLEGLTDGIKSKVEAAVPEIPQPEANLQAEMTAMMSSLDNPGEFLSKLKGIKDKFGSAVDIDSMFDNLGLDKGKLEELSGNFDKVLGDASVLARQSAEGRTSLIGDLGSLAGGDLSSVDSLLGKIPSITKPGFDSKKILDDICTAVPNIDLDKEGNFVKKGVPTKEPSEDGEAVEEASEANNTAAPEKDKQPSDNLENSQNVILNPDGEKAKEIEKVYSEELQTLRPLLAETLAEQSKIFSNRDYIFRLQNENNRRFRKPSQTKREQNIENIKRTREENRILIRKTTAQSALIQFKFETIEYRKSKAYFDAGLISQEPKKVTTTFETIHEKTFFGNYSSIQSQIEALPDLVITGEKVDRVDFSKDTD